MIPLRKKPQEEIIIDYLFTNLSVQEQTIRKIWMDKNLDPLWKKWGRELLLNYRKEGGLSLTPVPTNVAYYID